MSNNRSWSFVLAGIGTIGTLATIFATTNLQVQRYSLVALAACILLGLLSSILFALRSKKLITVTLARTEVQVEAAWLLGDATYRKIKKHYPSETLVKQWWMTYPMGIWICRDECDEILGYFSIWPVKREIFEQLKDGVMQEDELESKYISSIDSNPFEYWYVADICRTKKSKNHAKEVTDYMVNSLIATAFRYFIRHSQMAQNAQIIAFAESSAGAARLRQFGFTKVSQEKNIWIKSVTKLNVLKRVEHCCVDLKSLAPKTREALSNQ